MRSSYINRVQAQDTKTQEKGPHTQECRYNARHQVEPQTLVHSGYTQIPGSNATRGSTEAEEDGSHIETNRQTNNSGKQSNRTETYTRGLELTR